MSPHQLSFSVLFFFFFLCFSFSRSSESDDMAALLSFMASSNHPISLSSHPCTWLGVTCNPTTQRVTRLVLENHNLTGSILPLSALNQLRVLSLSHNHLSSASNLNFSLWPNLKHLYLSHNRFSGTFPIGLSNLRRLRRLDLSFNNFSGEIPMAELTQLPFLLTLRLQANSFTGTLNLNSVNLSSPLSDFNVSANHLSGKIPASLSRFPATSFTENANLCGEPLQYDCSNRTAEIQSVQSGISDGKTKSLSDRVLLLIITFDLVAILAIIMTVGYYCYNYKKRNINWAHKEVKSINNVRYGGDRRRREEEEMEVFEGGKKYNKVDDLLKASAELLGKGSVGTTYKVVMEGGDVVVVKRVRGERRKRKEVVDGFLHKIGWLRHTNIVSLRAYYQSKEELLLVYDFLPNGSLHSLLHGNRGPGRTPLDWTTRLKLAAGSAQGLAFLHSYNKDKLFHGHFTSSNIIIDQLGNACIADIGLHQLLPAPSSSTQNAYTAPELIPNNNINSYSPKRYTQKCDVHSFGVILLEILTGKMAAGEGETSLVKWVRHVVQKEWSWEVFDFELMRCKEMKEEMVALLQIAMLCLAPLPRDRPKMSVVLKMIEDIRVKGNGEGQANSFLNDLSADTSPS